MIRKHGVYLCAILESHIQSKNLRSICSKVFSSWNWMSNHQCCHSGTRIIIGWNPSFVDVMLISQTDQVMHCQVKLIVENKSLFCSFVYAGNLQTHRRELWDNLLRHSKFVKKNPWSMMGDFNVSLNMEDSSSSMSGISAAMREFKECISSINMEDINSSGFHFTWHQKRLSGAGIMKKIDRVMGNDGFITNFDGAYADFQAFGLSDHCPAILKFPVRNSGKTKSFRFANFITNKPEFYQLVADAWKVQVGGHKMFQIVKKLCSLKKPCRNLMWNKGNLHERVNELRGDLETAQRAVEQNPYDDIARAHERRILNLFNEVSLDEERLLKQRSKIQWLKVGDTNTAYFHKVVKGKQHRSHIQRVVNSESVTVEGDLVPRAFVDHYTKFLGSQSQVNPIRNPRSLFSKTLPRNIAMEMVRPIMKEDVKNAIFDIGEEKSAGPDGFTSSFFRAAWDVIGDDIFLAIQDFFRNGNLLREINHTVISLLPKVSTPKGITDYRPISCCNVLYKCISKILANRIKEGLNFIVSGNQSAFVPGRSISDSILLTQELIKNYHIDRGIPRCAFKIDIQKAYDTVNWTFLRNILTFFGFHVKMVDWIMTCVSSTSFSINVNGELHGFFKGERGLRQGDPISPYLFTLVMELKCLLCYLFVMRKKSPSSGFTQNVKLWRLLACVLRTT